MPLFPKSMLIAAVSVGIAGCATAWKTKSTFYEPVQTVLEINTQPPTRISVNNRFVGTSPLSVPLNYEREVKVERRRVSYWKTEPGWSLFLTLGSLGLYLPFSFIPIDTESRFVPTGNFHGNVFHIGYRFKGELLGEQTLECHGEKSRKIVETFEPKN